MWNNLLRHARVGDPALTSTRDHGLPLTREAIARKLSRPSPPREDRDLHAVTLPAGARVTHAAVLVPLICNAAGITILFTQRTEHLDDHASQISFPGGRVELSDRSREDTALRETEEEIGLRRAAIEILGRLPDYEIPSGFRITPVVGWIESPLVLQPDSFEVAGVFEVPLAHFLDPENFQRRQYHFRGRHRHYMAIPYQGRYIWGATAGMLYDLCQALRD
jgi:8-oxo-dGTP pyrophosphatase MutT (NUDIX family)